YYRDIKGNFIFSDVRFDLGAHKINKGDKLAQLVIVPIWTPALQEVDEFSEVSERGEKGFGSSGF
ncbi:dUTP pyrophosphatase, partial [Staphylococcus agnetis]|nr:dUTP pyrophosphatase [Staphylococcus agnetis]